MAPAPACTCRTPGASAPTAASRCRASRCRSSMGASPGRHPTTAAKGARAMLLAATEYVRPDSLEDALAALGGKAGSRGLAGGQTLINVLKHRAASVELLVDVSRLEELRFIDVAADGSAPRGAAPTYRELEQSAELRAAQPTIGEVAAGTVDRQVRARGTIGGNACFADPASN